ncbi:MAG: glutamyl-tRNA reductase, partial [Planctomycetota bacterium]
MRILCLGISHKTAELAVRERLAFDGRRVRHALRALRSRWPEAEFALLSTCNRTEVYVAREVHGHPRENELRRWLGEIQGVEEPLYEHALYTLPDGEAVRHLFEVAGGLDSLVPGEVQIVAQVKEAYQQAIDAGTAGATLNELLPSALRVSKQIRSETDIASGKLSVASVAVSCVTDLFPSVADRCVLVIGAGKMGELMLRHLAQLQPGRILVTNRSRHAARELARRCGGTPVDFPDLHRGLLEADIVLTYTAADGPVLTKPAIEKIQHQRQDRPLLLIDTAVPRDVAPAAGRCPGVVLYNVDDLDRIVRQNLAARQQEQPVARSIIERHVGELMESFNVRAVAPTIDALYAQMEQIAGEELADARNKFSTHADSAEDLRILQRTLR